MKNILIFWHRKWPARDDRHCASCIGTLSSESCCLSFLRHDCPNFHCNGKIIFKRFFCLQLGGPGRYSPCRARAKCAVYFVLQVIDLLVRLLQFPLQSAVDLAHLVRVFTAHRGATPTLGPLGARVQGRLRRPVHVHDRQQSQERALRRAAAAASTNNRWRWWM